MTSNKTLKRKEKPKNLTLFTPYCLSPGLVTWEVFPIVYRKYSINAVCVSMNSLLSEAREEGKKDMEKMESLHVS